MKLITLVKLAGCAMLGGANAAPVSPMPREVAEPGSPDWKRDALAGGSPDWKREALAGGSPDWKREGE
ncbi:hypothetical protein LTR22_000980 [Elasticomyces elasticus]|nr:hypothetical protein LTR22_000980 [Elasticomyces elasticus]KAK4922786.1 hypothetical protein LTR49_009974 [Elasticomyces elasticus]